MHGRQDRFADLAFQVRHAAVPGIGGRVTHAQQRQYSLRSTEGFVTERVGKEPVAVAVRVAAVAAHPTIVRHSGVVKEQFAAVARR